MYAPGISNNPSEYKPNQHKWLRICRGMFKARHTSPTSAAPTLNVSPSLGYYGSTSDLSHYSPAHPMAEVEYKKRARDAEKYASMSIGLGQQKVPWPVTYVDSDSDSDAAMSGRCLSHSRALPGWWDQPESQDRFTPAIPSRDAHSGCRECQPQLSSRTRGSDAPYSDPYLAETSHSRPKKLAWSFTPPDVYPGTSRLQTNSAIDKKIWSRIGRLEDDLVSEFGRYAVPLLSALRQGTAPSAPPTSPPRVRERAMTLPSGMASLLQQQTAYLSARNVELEKFREPYPPHESRRAKATVRRSLPAKPILRVPKSAPAVSSQPPSPISTRSSPTCSSFRISQPSLSTAASSIAPLKPIKVKREETPTQTEIDDLVDLYADLS